MKIFIKLLNYFKINKNNSSQENSRKINETGSGIIIRVKEYKINTTYKSKNRELRHMFNLNKVIVIIAIIVGIVGIVLILTRSEVVPNSLTCETTSC